MPSISRTENYEDFEIEVKRFYAPFVLTHSCSNCGNEIVREFESRYLSYPCIGESGICVWCEECDNEDNLRIRLDMHMEVVGA